MINSGGLGKENSPVKETRMDTVINRLNESSARLDEDVNRLRSFKVGLIGERPAEPSGDGSEKQTDPVNVIDRMESVARRIENRAASIAREINELNEGI